MRRSPSRLRRPARPAGRLRHRAGPTRGRARRPAPTAADTRLRHVPGRAGRAERRPQQRGGRASSTWPAARAATIRACPSAPSPPPCWPATSTRPRRWRPTGDRRLRARQAAGPAGRSRSRPWPTARARPPSDDARRRRHRLPAPRGRGPARRPGPRPRPATPRARWCGPQVRGDRLRRLLRPARPGPPLRARQALRRGRDRLQGADRRRARPARWRSWPMAASWSGAAAAPTRWRSTTRPWRAIPPSLALQGRPGPRRGRQGARRRCRPSSEGAAQALLAPAATMIQRQAGPDRPGLSAPGAAARSAARRRLADGRRRAAGRRRRRGARARPTARPKPGSPSIAAAQAKLAWSYQSAGDKETALKLARAGRRHRRPRRPADPGRPAARQRAATPRPSSC